MQAKKQKKKSVQKIVYIRKLRNIKEKEFVLYGFLWLILVQTFVKDMTSVTNRINENKLMCCVMLGRLCKADNLIWFF